MKVLQEKVIAIFWILVTHVSYSDGYNIRWTHAHIATGIIYNFGLYLAASPLCVCPHEELRASQIIEDNLKSAR